MIWKERFIEKIESKHNVTAEEVEEVLFSGAHFRRAQKGRIKGEDLYVAYGQTQMGRYLVVFFYPQKQKSRFAHFSKRNVNI